MSGSQEFASYYRCPRCKQTAEFEIELRVWADFTRTAPDSTYQVETTGDNDYSVDSPARCTVCGLVGTVETFAVFVDGVDG